MYCPRCGVENDNNAKSCIKCEHSFEQSGSLNKSKIVFKRIVLILCIIFFTLILLFSSLFIAVGLSESEIALTVISGVFIVISLFFIILAAKESAKYIKKPEKKREVKHKNHAYISRCENLTKLQDKRKDNMGFDKISHFEKQSIGYKLSPKEKLSNLVVNNPSISLVQDETCYYLGDASAVHQKNIVTGHINRGTGGSIRIAKGVSVRVGGGTSQTIRENVNEYYEGKLYITNYRIILLAPKYGFDLFVSKITQLIYKNDGIQIYCGAKCYSVFTRDVLTIREIIEFLNDQKVFKDEKYKTINKNNLNNQATHELRELKSLLDDGVITQEEFDAKKKQILNLL